MASEINFFPNNHLEKKAASKAAFVFAAVHPVTVDSAFAEINFLISVN